MSLSFFQYHSFFFLFFLIHLIVCTVSILHMKYLAESVGHSHQDLFGWSQVKEKITCLWKIEDVKLPWTILANENQHGRSKWKVYLFQLLCVLCTCKKRMHVGIILSAAHLHVSAQELLDRFWWNFVWSVCHWRSPQIGTVQFHTFGSSTLADAQCATVEMLWLW